MKDRQRMIEAICAYDDAIAAAQENVPADVALEIDLARERLARELGLMDQHRSGTP